MRRAAEACLLAAVAALLVSLLLGNLRVGVALAAGLLLGSLNAPMAKRALSSELGYRATSLARLTILTAAALGIGALLGWGLVAALVLAGLALSQGILAGSAVREMLRA